ncbi:MAG: ATP-binding protein [Firmicutes bacterium]|nr:ATP-binding protein [Bacillota bacterium]MBQ1714963.1 ATP-binding protein [Bacillota bacterium]MBQ2160466.1 ATP-binding protein [Bacillota bacterium]MBQ2305659.1 ATP-binding protein [Bacillota bacterium]
MRRKIMQELVKWKESGAGKTALLIDGARRVGKSYIAEAFARENYKSYIVIDFNQVGEDIKELFDNYLMDLDSLFMYLSAIYGVKLYPGESLIILDEIQMFPRARAAIKYLVKDGRYHYLETGSLMSVRSNVEDIVIPSEERHLKLFPMDFEEFLWAMSEEQLAEAIKINYEKKSEMGQALHRKCMTLFRQYVIVGGMPQAVQTYIETRDYEETDAVKRDILNLYRQDIAKHARGYAQNVTGIFDEIPAQLSKHEKKFILSSLGKGARYRDYDNSFLWLEDSMICNICYNSTEPSVGIKMNRDRTTMKIYMGDTGLLISHAFDENGLVDEEVYKKILLGKLEINEGMVFENIVAQMLTASGHKLYFYSNASRNDKNMRMEIDFLITKGKVTSRHNISPIEVKSGKRYTFNSLKKFMDRYHEQLNTPYILHTSDLMEKEGIIYLPVYMAWLL